MKNEKTKVPFIILKVVISNVDNDWIDKEQICKVQNDGNDKHDPEEWRPGPAKVNKHHDEVYAVEQEPDREFHDTVFQHPGQEWIKEPENR